MKRIPLILVALAAILAGCDPVFAQPTNLPAPAALGVSVNTNGQIIAPTNFFAANAANFASAITNAGVVMKADNVAGMVALQPGSQGQQVSVAGYLASGDWGAARVFTYSTNTALSTNRGTIFAASTGGRWVSSDAASRVIDPRWFGGLPNAVTNRSDTSGVDHVPGAQAAADYLAARGGGKLAYGAGSYRMDTTLVVPPAVEIEGLGGAYTQGYEDSAIYLSGATRFYAKPGGTNDWVVFRGIDSASKSGIQTIFTAGDLSMVTNYNHSGAIRGISFDSGYTGLRGRCIFVDSAFGVTIENIGFAPYGVCYPIYIWGSNVIKVRDVSGLTRWPIFAAYSADNEFSHVVVGGMWGPGLWLKGAKNRINGGEYFNTQEQPNTVRPTFTVNTGTDLLTVSDANVGKNWFTEMPVSFEVAAGSTLPAPLITNSVYYLIRVSDTTFKVNQRRDWNVSGIGGAKQEVAMDITSAGTGTFTVGPGPKANILVDTYDLNQFVNVRADQSAGDGIQLWNAANNAFTGCSFTESGWASATTEWAAVRAMGASHNNDFIACKIANRNPASSHAAYGLISDGGPTNLMWFGSVSGVTNVFGNNAQSWYVQGWDPSTRSILVWSGGGWRNLQTIPPGLTPAQYDAPGIMRMDAPTTGIYSAQFSSQTSSETVLLKSFSDNAGQGPTVSMYAYGGSLASPTQVLGGKELWEILGSAYNGSSMVFSISSIGAYAPGAVVTGNAPTRLFMANTPTNSATRLKRMVLFENGAASFSPEGISDSSAAPASVGLELNSTSSAFVPSRMTKAQRNALTATNGMVIYQTDNTPGLRAYENGAWVKYAATADP